MQVEMFILCDGFLMAKTPDGRPVWSIVGPFDSIDLPIFPAQISFTIVTSIRFDAEQYGEASECEVETVLTDPDLRPVTDFYSKKPLKNARKIKFQNNKSSHCDMFVWQVGKPGVSAGAGGAGIEKPGDYFFCLNVKGKYFARLPLHIHLPK